MNRLTTYCQSTLCVNSVLWLGGNSFQGSRKRYGHLV